MEIILKGAYIGKTVTVGRYQPNAWGLYDMHGNVCEWVQDIYNQSYQNLPVDGTANLTVGNSSSRVLRGGSWRHPDSSARAASRDWSRNLFDFSEAYGFRVVARLR